MTVGTIGYATNSGLGILINTFYRKSVVDRVLVIKHPDYKNHDWYGTDGYKDIDKFLDGLDTLLLFENPFNWDIVKKARDLGIRIVMMPMYEYTPNPCPVEPDLYICPSELDLEYFPNRSVFIPVPVDTDSDTVRWRLRSVASTFVHNAGHGGVHYRNGTPELLRAMALTKTPVRLTVRGQPDDKKILTIYRQFKNHPKVDFQIEHVPSEDLYTQHDVFVFPEKFNGLSLPLQEAYASGMLVIATDRFPMNTWLPKDPLIPVSHYARIRIATKLKSAVVSPQRIAAKIDEFYEQDIESYSMAGLQWGCEHSWDNLRSKYLEVLES